MFIYPAAEPFLTDIRDYVYGIQMHNEDQLRYPVFGTKQLLAFWTFSWETAIVELAGPQSKSHSNKSYISHIHKLICSVPLENPN